MAPGVTVLILNWNGRKYLSQFLPSVLRTEYENFEVLVADNGSTDDSVAFLKENFPQVRVLELDRNYGFTQGNNLALDHISTPYYVLLNSDVEVTPGWLAPLVAAAEADPKVASVQPKIRAFHAKDHFEYAGAAGGFIDTYGYPFCRGRIFETLEKDEGQYDAPAEILWATGACCLIRKSVSDEIGLFEPTFFAHMEEIDFCWRAKNKGYKILCVPQGTVYHVGGGTLNKTSPRKTYLNVRNSLSAMILNFPDFSRWWKLWVRLILDGVWGFKALLQFDFGTIGAILKGHWHFFFKIPYLNKRRKAIYGKNSPGIPETGVYGKSIVWTYFARGLRKFSQLGMKTQVLRQSEGRKTA